MLDQIAGGLLGQLGGQGQQGQLAQVVMSMVQSKGGLSGLLQQFQSAGLQQQVASWVGTGKNLPISPDQISQVLGKDALAGMAQKLGMNTQQVSGGLAEVLPQVVDKLTPNGAIDESSIAQQIGGLLQKFGAR